MFVGILLCHISRKKKNLNKIVGLFSQDESARCVGRNQDSSGNIKDSVIIPPGLGSGPYSASLMPVMLTELLVPLKCKEPRQFGVRDVPNLITTEQHMV